MISESYKSKKKDIRVVFSAESYPLSLSLFIDYYFFHLSIKIRNEFTKKHQFNIFFFQNIFFLFIFIISFSFTIGGKTV